MDRASTAVVRVSQKPQYSSRSSRVSVTRTGWARAVAWNGVEEIRLFAMPSPRDERFLVLLQVKVRIEQRMIGDAQNGTAESAGSFQSSVGAFLDRMTQGLEGGVILRFQGGLNVHDLAPFDAEGQGD